MAAGCGPGKTNASGATSGASTGGTNSEPAAPAQNCAVEYRTGTQIWSCTDYGHWRAPDRGARPHRLREDSFLVWTTTKIEAPFPAPGGRDALTEANRLVLAGRQPLANTSRSSFESFSDMPLPLLLPHNASVFPHR